MKIIHINTSAYGGAGLAASRLNNALNSIGVTSSLFTLHGADNNNRFFPDNTLQGRISRYIYRQKIDRDFNRYFSSRPNNLEKFSDDRSEYKKIIEQLPEGDIINLHWIANFIDYRNFFKSIPKRIPLVWTLHDMNPFTGGCHYSGDCRKYTESCGNCPQLGSTNSKDLSFEIWKRKRHAFSFIDPNRLHFVCPSAWLAQIAKQSSLLSKYNIHTIPNSVDTNNFKPQNKAIVREALRLPTNAKIILVGAVSINNYRKGMHLLQKAIASLSPTENIILLTLGDGNLDAGIPFQIRQFGDVSNSIFISLLYNAADVFVIPSLEDNLPNTVLEAISCGTPVVGFNTGGIPEMIRNSENGLIVSKGDTKALGENILLLLQNKNLRLNLSDRARQIAVSEYNYDIQSQRYRSLYETLLNEKISQTR